jgi:hypothetical protein
MRWIAATALVLLQAGELPAPYPRPGTTKLFENTRVVVWDISWLKQQYPLHRHVRALVGVYYSPGDRTIISTEGARRPVTTAAWQTVFQQAGVTHVEEGASDIPLRAVFVEMKEASASAAGPDTGAPRRFPGGAGNQTLDNDRTTAWEFIPPPSIGIPHRHAFDAVVVAFKGTTPHVTFVPRATVHGDEGAAGADRMYVFEIK